MSETLTSDKPPPVEKRSRISIRQTDVFRSGIREASEASGLSRRALRHYEARGLIQVGRDDINYRRYDEAARMRLEWIRKLRAAGLSLSDIGDVFGVLEAGGDVSAAAASKLTARRQALLEQLAQLERVAAEFEVSTTIPSIEMTRRRRHRPF